MSRGGPAADLSREVQSWEKRGEKWTGGILTELSGDVRSKEEVWRAIRL